MRSNEAVALALLSLGVTGFALALYLSQSRLQRGWRRLFASTEDLAYLDLFDKIMVADQEFDNILNGIDQEMKDCGISAADRMPKLDTTKLTKLEQTIAELDNDLDFVFSKLDSVPSTSEYVKNDRKQLISRFQEHGQRIDALKTILREAKHSEYDYISALTATI